VKLIDAASFKLIQDMLPNVCCKDTTNCLKFSSLRRPFLTLITRC
jgi:hypothetical protein